MMPTHIGTSSLYSALPRGSSSLKLVPESWESSDSHPRMELRGGGVWLEKERGSPAERWALKMT